MKFTLIPFLLLLISCNSDEKFSYTGKRIYYPIQSNLISVELPDTILKIKTPSDDSTDWYSPMWLNKTDSILINVSKKSGIECFDNFVCLIDLTGKIIDTIYKSEPCYDNEFIISPNDSFLLIRRTKHSDFLNEKPLDTTWNEYKVEYLIFNIHEHKISNTIFLQSNIYLSSFEETPWCNNSKNVVIVRRNKSSPNNMQPEEGYLYNIQTGDTSFISKGYDFVCSPKDSNLMCYFLDNSIWLYNIVTKQHEKFYTFENSFTIKHIRWDINGQELYIYGYRLPYLLKSFSKFASTPYEIHIDIKTKKKSKTKGYKQIDSWK